MTKGLTKKIKLLILFPVHFGVYCGFVYFLLLQFGDFWSNLKLKCWRPSPRPPAVFNIPSTFFLKQIFTLKTVVAKSVWKYSWMGKESRALSKVEQNRVNIWPYKLERKKWRGWIEVSEYCLCIGKLFLAKLVTCFGPWTFFLRKLHSISMNLLLDHAWNTTVMFGLLPQSAI